MHHTLNNKYFDTKREIDLIKASYTNNDTQRFDPVLFETIKYKFSVYENSNNNTEIIFFRDEVNFDYLTPRMYAINFTPKNYPEKGEALEYEDDVFFWAYERLETDSFVKLYYERETFKDYVWEDTSDYLPQELTDFFKDMLRDEAFCKAFIEKIS